MYPGKKPHLGIFVQKQVEFLKTIGIDVVTVVKCNSDLSAYVLFYLRTIFNVIFSSYDIIHAHYGFHSAFIPALLKRNPLIITFHGSDARKEPFRNKLFYFLQKISVRKADHIVAVSREIKDILITDLAVNPDKISVISCGVDTSHFIPLNQVKVRNKLGIDLKRRVVLFVGHMVYTKGVDILYECARYTPDVTYIFIGDGPLKNDYKNCIFIDPIPNSDIPLWINAADIFVLPSRMEGTPVVVLEALSCGIPVICSKVGGCPDIIKDGETGFLVTIHNPLTRGKITINHANLGYPTPIEEVNMVREKIIELMTNDDLRKKIGKRGREKMIADYDNKIIAQKIKKVYEHAVEK